MQNMGISIALIVLIIIAGLIAGTRLSAPGSQRRAVTWAFGVLSVLVILFFILINATPGEWIVPLFTVLCIVLPICVYVVASRMSPSDGTAKNSSTGAPRLFGRKDFTLPKGSPNTLQAKAPEGPKPPTAEEKAAAAAAAAKPSATVSGIPLSPQPLKNVSAPSKPAPAAAPKPASKPPKPKPESKPKPKPEPKIVEVDLRALDKTADAPAKEPVPKPAASQEDAILNELPDALKAPAPEAPSSEQAAAIIAAAEDFLAATKDARSDAVAKEAALSNVPEQPKEDLKDAESESSQPTEEIPVLDVTSVESDAVDSIEESLEATEEIPLASPQPTEEIPSAVSSAAPTPAPAPAPTPAPSSASSPAASQAPAPKAPEPVEPKAQPKPQMDPYMAFRAKAAGLSSQGNYAVAAIIYAQAAQAAPTAKDARNAKFDELACYVKADDIAKAKALAFQLRQSSVLTRFERLKLDAVERMS